MKYHIQISPSVTLFARCLKHVDFHVIVNKGPPKWINLSWIPKEEKSSRPAVFLFIKEGIPGINPPKIESKFGCCVRHTLIYDIVYADWVQWFDGTYKRTDFHWHYSFRAIAHSSFQYVQESIAAMNNSIYAEGVNSA